MFAMPSSSQMPIALCGKSPHLAAKFVQAFEGSPYTVVHVCHNTATAKAELPPLLSGQHTTVRPQSKLGRNATSETAQVPRAIAVGLGFNEGELQDMMSACERDAASAGGRGDVVWMYPSPEKTAETRALPGGESMAHVAMRIQDALGEHFGSDEGPGKGGKGRVLSF